MNRVLLYKIAAIVMLGLGMVVPLHMGASWSPSAAACATACCKTSRKARPGRSAWKGSR